MTSLVWFRIDLRLADNPALTRALETGRPVLPVYIHDEGSAIRRAGAASDWWLDKSLRALGADLAGRGAPLVLRRGDSEAELRRLWSAPETRSRLLEGLAEKGFGHEQLAEMQRIIDAERSDLFDVLAYVAYALPTRTREERASGAKQAVADRFNNRQQSFIDFVLEQYVRVGVEELGQEKLAPLLRLKYRDAIADAIDDLGPPESISEVFTGFQQYLYAGVA